MNQSDDSLLTALTALNKDQINQAGHRYTPGVDPEAPNIEIKPLITAIENVACGAVAQKRFVSFLDEYSEAWNRAKFGSQSVESLKSRLKDAHACVAPMLARLRACEAEAKEEWLDLLTCIESDLSADLNFWRAEEAKLETDEGTARFSSARNEIRAKINELGKCFTIVQDEKEYVESPAFEVLFDPNLLIGGEWETGKTHLVCDFTQYCIDHDRLSVLVLAKNFKDDVVKQICARIGGGFSTTEVFDQIQELSRERSERAIIILDGVNEGSRTEWRKAVSSLRALVADRPNIGLIVTCRTPFERVAIAQGDLEKFHKINHQGFEDDEFDAQAAFFQYYQLPLPEVPLLNEEFSRPLTLKLICQSLQKLSKKELKKGFAGIASGQKGMTFVLESFVNCIGESIESEYGLKPKSCWRMLKGGNEITDRLQAGFAPCMVANSQDFVRPAEADCIITANCPKLSPAQRRKLLDAFRTNGLIEEDVVWSWKNSGNSYRTVLRLPYQRFSDHLIARELLKTHLDVSSRESIKESFTGKSPLALIFRIPNRFRAEYSKPGWAQALITEFPERVKKHLPAEECELFYALPKRAQNLDAYLEPFIAGLFWRSPSAFTKATNAMINQYLSAGSYARNQALDALVAVSTKPKHPYHARRLYDFLARHPMPERDLLWSEYLRRHLPTMNRLLTWAEKLDEAKMTESIASELVVLLSLVLTTVVRRDRDLATKALVLIGEKFPELLFKHALTTLKFNDLYVPERMLAAAYGITMSLVDSEEASTFRPLLRNLAETLYREMFGPGAHKSTHHTLMRDYALGIIEIAQNVGCVTFSHTAIKSFTPPFPHTQSTFTSDGTPHSTVKEAINHAIQMDFENYTIGGLIPERGNYEYDEPNYLKVREKIERRIFDLGYRAESFGDVDGDIGYSSRHEREEEKVDRYGKKYSWIAYFEMWGELEADVKLKNWKGERTPDCGVDPSFPKRPPSWSPSIPALFGDSEVATEKWVRSDFTPNWHSLLTVKEINDHIGEWVLVQGYVCGVDEILDRELFAFLRGLFVSRQKDVHTLKQNFLKEEYPGNNKIPVGATESYLYAGEAGRRRNYMRRLFRRNTGYCRQLENAFKRYVSEDPGVRIEIPYVHFGWESYHSAYNDFSGFNLPAPSLIQRLRLTRKNRDIDFYDSDGDPGTLYREAGNPWSGNRYSLLYVRADLLQRYLKETHQVLVWCNWGERDWMKKMEDHKRINESDRLPIYQAYANIHRSFAQWSAKDRRII